MSVGWQGRTAEVLLMLTALFVFVYVLARGAPVGVVIFASVYLLGAAVTVLPRWWARRDGGAPPLDH